MILSFRIRSVQKLVMRSCLLTELQVPNLLILAVRGSKQFQQVAEQIPMVDNIFAIRFETFSVDQKGLMHNFLSSKMHLDVDKEKSRMLIRPEDFSDNCISHRCVH